MNKMYIIVRSCPINKAGRWDFPNEKNKLDIIKICLESIQRQIDQRFELIVATSKYDEHSLRVLTSMNIKFVKGGDGDNPSQNFCFRLADEILQKDSDSDVKIFVTEDDYYFYDGFLNKLYIECDKHKDTIFSPHALGAVTYYEEDELEYIGHCYVNFAGHRKIYSAISKQLIETTDGGDIPLRQELIFTQNVWNNHHPFSEKK
jgi:uncharacterized protein YneR